MSCLNCLIWEYGTKTIRKGAENHARRDVGNPGSSSQLSAEML